MADEQQLATLLQGAAVWNRWRDDNPFTLPDLTAINLGRARLDGVNLKDANLAGAFFGKCQLANVDFTNAVLASSRFHKCYLAKALFREIDTSRVSFVGSDITEGQFDGSTLWFSEFDGAILESANFRGTNLSYSSCRNTSFKKADLSGANLSCASFVRTGFEEASLSNSLVYGVSVWDARMDGTLQSDLIITPENQPRISVDNLEVAQFIYLLLKNERIRDVINTIAKKAVLILGRFSEGRKEILDAIANGLRERDFLPIIFDFERSRERDFTETIKILAGLSLFVITDITNPKSNPLELQAIVPDYSITFVPIIRAGEEPFSMFNDLQNRYNWVLDVIEYDTKEYLEGILADEIIQPALSMRHQLVNRRNEDIRIRRLRKF
jgi:uncharacterized protein YjbI with pentapeptide repeats